MWLTPKPTPPLRNLWLNAQDGKNKLKKASKTLITGLENTEKKERKMRAINEIIIHCSATRPKWREDQTLDAKVKEIGRWHREEGYDMIGYHYVIDRDGAVAKGREDHVQGAHCKAQGRNRHSLGICLLGGHGSNADDEFLDHFTAKQAIAKDKLIKQLRKKYVGISHVSGHNEYANRACPGFRVSEQAVVSQIPNEVRTLSGGKIKVPAEPGRKKSESKTLRAAVAVAVASAGGLITSVSSLEGTTQLALIGCTAVVLIAAIVVFKERLNKWAAGDR